MKDTNCSLYRPGCRTRHRVCLHSVCVLFCSCCSVFGDGVWNLDWWPDPRRPHDVTGDLCLSHRQGNDNPVWLGHGKSITMDLRIKSWQLGVFLDVLLLTQWSISNWWCLTYSVCVIFVVLVSNWVAGQQQLCFSTTSELPHRGTERRGRDAQNRRWDGKRRGGNSSLLSLEWLLLRLYSVPDFIRQ